MNRIKNIIFSVLVLAGLAVTPIATAPAFASINPQEEACTGTGGHWSGGKCTGNTTTGDLSSVVTTIVNVLLYIIGAVAVVMIIVGAFRYVTSGGNSASITAAKNTILYAVVGLVIAILAYAIVNFVIKSLIK